MADSTTSSVGTLDTGTMPSSKLPSLETEGGIASIGQADEEPSAEQPPVDMEAFEMGNSQVVLILSGLIASGKSTFAQSLQSHFPRFQRCNQDDLGDRRRVEQMARDSLAQGLSVCIDRTNFNAAQRFHWIKIAREFPGTSIWVIVFDTPYEVCAARLQTRTDHPTITSPQQGLSVLARFAQDFEAPEAEEGYDRILYLTPEDHPSAEYTLSDIGAILKRVRDSPPVVATQPSTAHVPPSWIRGRGSLHSGAGGRGSGQPYRGRGAGWAGPYGPNHNHRDGGPEARYFGTGTGVSTAFRGWGASPFRGSNNRGTAGWGSTGRGRGQQHGAVARTEGVPSHPSGSNGSTHGVIGNNTNEPWRR